MESIVRCARRSFLKTLAVGGAGVFAGLPDRLRAAPSPTPRGDRPAGAVIGLGNRGRGIAEWQMPPFAEVVAICDVDLRKTVAVARRLQQKTGRKVEVFQDYRRLLERRDIAVIANATCDHWHTKISVEACRAGKDVYCEKPLALTIAEGQLLRKVVQQTGRIVQVGTQQRSGLQFHIACSLVRNGRIGALKQVAVLLPGGNFRARSAVTPEPVPPEVDWDLWSGQAPLHPFSAARLNSFRSWLDYGGGLITDWGAHHLDIAHWGMGGPEVGPLSVEAAGFNPHYGQPDYPDQFVPFAARLEYPQGIELSFCSSYAGAKSSAKTEAQQQELERIYRLVPAVFRDDKRSGVLFVGSRGTIFVSRDEVTGEGIGELAQVPLAEEGGVRWRACMDAHMQNFVECVRTRREPISSVAEQHRTQIPAHLTNIALRLGRKLRWDAAREEFVGDTEANGLLRREQRAPYLCG
jgi:predicted dehydrogenase